ncbi:MAG: hypothetical protein E7319_08410 [Clostridiales bacterium]|nr:hypothetical protein [Clostridiales bacterium]
MTLSTRKSPGSLWRVFLYALLLSAAMLFICSKSSPAYPINDWADANVFFSAGKAMTQGKVMYRDLYDHKGPLLYFLHALCALISFDTFFGVYLLEVLSNALFLTIAYQLIVLWGAHRSAWAALPVIAVLLFTSLSFQMGDSAEELALPMMLFPLYQLLKAQRLHSCQTTPSQLLIAGFLLGCVFWLKFTLVGIPAAVCLMLAWLGLRRGGLKRALTDIGWMFLGFVLSTLPWLLYFWAVDGLLPFLKTYLYDNFFLYAGAEAPLTLLQRIKAIVKAILSWIIENPGYTLPLMAGMLWLLLSKKQTVTEKVTWYLCLALGMLGIFVGGRYYVYYGFALGALTPVCFLPVCRWIERRWFEEAAAPVSPRAAHAPKAALAALTAVCIAASFLSPNVSSGFLQKREETMQYRFAAIINQYDSPTMLNFGFLDAGFYTAAGVAPHVRFYHLTNVPLDEMRSEQERYVREGLCDFVVTRGLNPQSIDERYELVDSCPATEGMWYDTVYLYRLRTLGES